MIDYFKMQNDITKSFKKYSTNDIKELIALLSNQEAVKEFIIMLESCLRLKAISKNKTTRNKEQIRYRTNNVRVRGIISILKNTTYFKVNDVETYITKYIPDIVFSNKTQALQQFIIFLESQSNGLLDKILFDLEQYKLSIKPMKISDSENDLTVWTDIIMKKRDE